MARKYIWLIGENLSETANNNSFYFWKQSLNHNDEIDKYFVLTNTPRNRMFVKTLTPREQKFICYRNSLQHFNLFLKADIFFVTLSFRDVRPELFLGKKKCDLAIEKPLVYLQHGTLGIKQVGYTGHSYNNLFRFVYYNPIIKDKLISENKFKDYQLYYGEYLPRYQQLVNLSREKSNNYKQEKQILYFPTWREYFGTNLETEIFVEKIKRFLSDKKLIDYLEINNIKLRVCLHQFFDEKVLPRDLNNSKNIDIFFAKDIDVMHQIAFSDLCITDYSSIGFDFTLLKKPVILFQPDRKSYLSKRKIYCSEEELIENSVDNVDDLIDIIINQKYGINSFFATRMPKNIDFDYIAKGYHIDRMYFEFRKIQRESILFLGYKFYGIGGTVNATLALAEGLLEQGKLVTLLSLKKDDNSTNAGKGFPSELNMQALVWTKSKRKLDKLVNKFFNRFGSKGDLRYDPSVDLINPYANIGLKNFLKRYNYKTYISTRESLHLYLQKAKHIDIHQKYYFFHTQTKALQELFPGVLDKIKSDDFDNAIFVTEKHQKSLQKDLGFENYKHALVIGNSLTSNRSTNRNELLTNSNSNLELESSKRKISFINMIRNKLKERTKKVVSESIAIKDTPKIYRGISLLRISNERKSDIDYLIQFALLVKQKGYHNIKLDIYGEGNFKKEFANLIKENKLEDIIFIKGEVKNPKSVIKQHDFLVDFSEIQSFGMIYIEGILNGVPVFSRHNEGADEVLKDLPDCFYNSLEELLDKIINLKPEANYILHSYDVIAERFSRESVTKKLLDFIHE